MQHCKEEAEERLQDCFKSVDWATFKDSSVDLNEYATVVTDFIKTNVDEYIDKTIPRMTTTRNPG